MDSDSVRIDERKGLQHVYAHHLIGHLVLSAMAVDGFLIFSATVLGAPVILDIDDIAFLCHEHLPHPYLAEPCVLDHL